MADLGLRRRVIRILPAHRSLGGRERPRGAVAGRFTATYSENENMADDSHGHDHHHDHDECEGELRPIWEAKEKLEEDDEWRESLPEENVEKLRSAYEEWVEMGKPIPDPLPEDAEPPEDAGERVKWDRMEVQ